MRAVNLRALLLIEIRVRPPMDLGGGRRFIPFDGGSFTGYGGLEGRGHVLEGGIDGRKYAPMARSTSMPSTDSSPTGMSRSRSGPRGSARPRRPSPNGSHEGSRAARRVLLPDGHPTLNLGTASRLAEQHLAVSTGERERDTVRIHVHEIL